MDEAPTLFSVGASLLHDAQRALCDCADASKSSGLGGNCVVRCDRDLADLLFGVAQGGLPAVASQVGSLGTNYTYVGDAEKAEHRLQIGFLVFHGLAGFGRRVDTATRQDSDHGLALGQTLGALGRVAEGATGSCQAFSWLGIEKLYSGAPITMTSAARNCETNASARAFSRA